MAVLQDPKYWPRRGDVIFTFSGGPDAYASCVVQRQFFVGKVGRWFSHVAVAVDLEVAIEASTKPEESETTWSGVKLEGGVRLQTLPDLVFGASSFAVLRHPNGEQFKSLFSLQDHDISQLFGSGYSTKKLIEAAQSLNSAVLKLVPTSYFDWNAQPDVIDTAIRALPAKMRDEFENLMKSQSKLCNCFDYFCSELVAKVLRRKGLIDFAPAFVTPCGLFDLLLENGWQDVTESDYGAATKQVWTTMKVGYPSVYSAMMSKVRMVRASNHLLAWLDVLKNAAGDETTSATVLAMIDANRHAYNAAVGKHSSPGSPTGT